MKERRKDNYLEADRGDGQARWRAGESLCLIGQRRDKIAGFCGGGRGEVERREVEEERRGRGGGGAGRGEEERWRRERRKGEVEDREERWRRERRRGGG